MSKFKDIKRRIVTSLPYRHFQLVVIVGLVTGIGLQAWQPWQYLPQASAIEYVSGAVVIDDDCNQKCLLNRWATLRAKELYKENEAMDLEKYRLQAIVEGKDMLVSIMDESEFIDYDAMYDKYGY